MQTMTIRLRADAQRTEVVTADFTPAPRVAEFARAVPVAVDIYLYDLDNAPYPAAELAAQSWALIISREANARRNPPLRAAGVEIIADGHLRATLAEMNTVGLVRALDGEPHAFMTCELYSKLAGQLDDYWVMRFPVLVRARAEDVGDPTNPPPFYTIPQVDALLLGKVSAGALDALREDTADELDRLDDRVDDVADAVGALNGAVAANIAGLAELREDTADELDRLDDRVDDVADAVGALNGAVAVKADAITTGAELAKFPTRFNILPPGFIATVGVGGNFPTLQVAYNAAANGIFHDVTFQILPGTLGDIPQGVRIYRHGVKIVAASSGDRPILPSPLFWQGTRDCVLDGVDIVTTNRRCEVVNAAQVDINNCNFRCTNTGDSGVQVLNGAELRMTNTLFDMVGAGGGALYCVYARYQSQVWLTSVTMRGWAWPIRNQQSEVTCISGVVVENSGTVYATAGGRNVATGGAIAWLNTAESFSPAKNTTGNSGATNIV